MMDLARKNGVEIDAEALERELMVPVVPISARTGEGVDRLLEVIDRALTARDLPLATTSNETAGCGACHGCSHSQRYDWAEQIAARTTRRNLHLSVKRTEQIDRWLTHPVLGLLFFAVLMAAFFMSLFWLADWPMSLIEAGVAALGGWIRTCLPQGVFQSFVVDGVIGGVGGVIVFLPQICLLFFLLSLLEETGYLARAAFVMDRLMRRVGLPGKAFVPMLSAHACAIPAIMSTRVIDDRRDRLVTILILPLLTCSARLPVYALITAMLFAGQPLKGGLVFFGAYSLGILAALTMAWVFKRTILKGNSRPLLIELPTYKVPSLRNALLGSVDQGLQFLKKAGTVILLISIVLWAMATWPAMSKEDALARLDAAHRARFTRLEKELAAPEGLEEETRLEREAELERIVASRQLEHSLAGRLGKLIVPVFRPLGFDWRINVGVLSSFAARETFASTMGVIFSKGNHDKDPRALGAMLRGETRADGTRLFQTANCSSLLVFYIFAMQCLPTQAITRKETGSWKWAMFQLVYMTLLAYSAAFLTYRLLLWL